MRPRKVVPTDGADLVARWNAGLRALGYRDPADPAVLEATQVAWIDRGRSGGLGHLPARGEAVGVERRGHPGQGEVLLAQTNLVAEPSARIELAEDVTARAAARYVRLLASPECPNMSAR